MFSEVRWKIKDDRDKALDEVLNYVNEYHCTTVGMHKY